MGIKINEEILGTKKLNGAKLLNEEGYVESAIVVSKEIFRNYPKIASNFNDRLYFADLLKDLELFQEASSEYGRIKKIQLTSEEKIVLEKRNEEVSLKIMGK